MARNNLSASEVARRVWGTMKDSRGYEVARNRDRIGHYLSGTSYPEQANLEALAQAVGLSVEDLQIERPETGPPLRPRTANENVVMTPLPVQPAEWRVKVQIDRVISHSDMQALLDWLNKTNPVLGTAIEGGDKPASKPAVAEIDPAEIDKVA